MNGDCGWVDAEATMRYVLNQIDQLGGDRVQVRPASKVRRLLYNHSPSPDDSLRACAGVQLEDGPELHADLVVLAAGAWTPSLVDLEGTAIATGQVLAYLQITTEEQHRLESIPICFNLSRGMYMIPPHKGELKFGRHGFGYQNPTVVCLPEHNPEESAATKGPAQDALVSIPRTDIPIPVEGEASCREFLGELFPEWRDREFHRTRICWYCDT